MTSSIACERVSCNASEPVSKSGRDMHSVMLEVDTTCNAGFADVRKSRLEVALPIRAYGLLA